MSFTADSIRGMDSEDNARRALRELHKRGVVLSFRQTLRLSNDDLAGIDFYFSIRVKGKRIEIPLQVKSSMAGIVQHLAKGRDIHVVNGQSPYVLELIEDVIAEYQTALGEPNIVESKEEVKIVALDNSKIGIKHTPAEVVNYKDSKMLAEQTLPKLNKIDLTNVEQKMAQRTLSENQNSLIDYLQKLGSMVQSTQEYLLDLGVKMDNFKAPPVAQLAPIAPPKKTPEEIQAQRVATIKAAHAKRTDSKTLQVKAAQKAYPQFAKNAGALAGITGMGVKTIQGYMDKGLI